jgi:hypothetical protein
MDQEAKTYKYTVKYKKKDGTISEYQAARVAKPKVREVTKKDITDKIRTIDCKDKLKRIKEFIDKLDEDDVQPNEPEILPGQ